MLLLLLLLLFLLSLLPTGGGGRILTATHKDKKASHHHHHHHHVLSYCFLLAAATAFVIIAATVSFQHDTPIYQAAYAANNPDIYLFNASKHNPPRSFNGAYNKVEINSYGWVFILHKNLNIIEKYPAYDAGDPDKVPPDPPDTFLNPGPTITGLRNPQSFDLDPVDNNLVVLDYHNNGSPQIKVLDHRGTLLRVIGGEGHLVAPKDVAVSSSADRIYVIDKDSGTGKYTRIGLVEMII